MSVLQGICKLVASICFQQSKGWVVGASPQRRQTDIVIREWRQSYYSKQSHDFVAYFQVSVGTLAFEIFRVKVLGLAERAVLHVGKSTPLPLPNSKDGELSHKETRLKRIGKDSENILKLALR